MKNPLAQLKSLPKNQRIALGVGGAGALGAGLYSYRKKKLAGTSSSTAAPKANAVQSALSPTPDLSQYGQVAVLVPIDWQAGANFGGTGGLTAPLDPANPTNNPAPPPAPASTPAPWLEPTPDPRLASDAVARGWGPWTGAGTDPRPALAAVTDARNAKVQADAAAYSAQQNALANANWAQAVATKSGPVWDQAREAAQAAAAKAGVPFQ